MTPKDKAKELVERFTKSQATILTPESKIMFSTIAALVCVDEMIAVLNSGNLYMEHGREDSKTYNTSPEYWEEVKIEIEKL